MQIILRLADMNAKLEKKFRKIIKRQYNQMIKDLSKEPLSFRIKLALKIVFTPQKGVAIKSKLPL